MLLDGDVKHPGSQDFHRFCFIFVLRLFVLDLDDESSEGIDVVPGSDTGEEDESERRRLQALAREAEGLQGKVVTRWTCWSPLQPCPPLPPCAPALLGWRYFVCARVRSRYVHSIPCNGDPYVV